MCAQGHTINTNSHGKKLVLIGGIGVNEGEPLTFITHPPIKN